MSGFDKFIAWIHRENHDHRYDLYSKVLDSVAENRIFRLRYEDICIQTEARKRPFTHYLFMAAVHFSVLRSPDSDLARYFPSSPSFEPRLGYGLLGRTFLEFCDCRWSSLEEIVRAREVQINKLGRNALMLPLLVEANERAGGPAVFVEVGSSVGLGLLWPWLATSYSTGSRIVGRFFDGGAVCECSISGATTLPLSGTSPDPVRLVGIEIDPLNADQNDDVDWLRALVAPNDAVSRAELERGLTLLREHRPKIIQGCMLKRLRDIVADMAGGQPLIVYHCMTLQHLIESGKLDAWHQLLRLTAHSRPVVEAYVAWEEGEPSATPWPVEIRIREWHREKPRSELIGWSDPSADGTSIRFRSESPELKGELSLPHV